MFIIFCWYDTFKFSLRYESMVWIQFVINRAETHFEYIPILVCQKDFSVMSLYRESIQYHNELSLWFDTPSTIAVFRCGRKVPPV